MNKFDVELSQLSHSTHAGVSPRQRVVQASSRHWGRCQVHAQLILGFRKTCIVRLDKRYSRLLRAMQCIRAARLLDRRFSTHTRVSSLVREVSAPQHLATGAHNASPSYLLIRRRFRQNHRSKIKRMRSLAITSHPAEVAVRSPGMRRRRAVCEPSIL